jgi:hypothetical protein
MENIFKAKLNIFTKPVFNALKDKTLNNYISSILSNNNDPDEICRWYYFLKFYKYILKDNIYYTKQFERELNKHNFNTNFNSELIKFMLEKEN